MRAGRRRYLSSSIEESIRSAQAVETFRSAYYKSAKTPATLSMTDITQILLAERVRPSLFINLFEVLGHASGSIARIAPIRDAESLLTAAIDNAATQQLNDSIRRLSSLDGAEDVRETLKFHRDIRVQMQEEEATSSDSNSSTANASLKDMLQQLDCKTVLTTSLYQTFKIAEKL
jgi:demethoxyubiquinone hydroxylase (CLK1/Coq7/Cat5 family)